MTETGIRQNRLIHRGYELVKNLLDPYSLPDDDDTEALIALQQLYPSLLKFEPNYTKVAPLPFEGWRCLLSFLFNLKRKHYFKAYTLVYGVCDCSGTVFMDNSSVYIVIRDALHEAFYEQKDEKINN